MQDEWQIITLHDVSAWAALHGLHYSSWTKTLCFFISSLKSYSPVWLEKPVVLEQEHFLYMAQKYRKLGQLYFMIQDVTWKLIKGPEDSSIYVILSVPGYFGPLGMHIYISHAL